MRSHYANKQLTISSSALPLLPAVYRAADDRHWPVWLQLHNTGWRKKYAEQHCRFAAKRIDTAI
ncbi:hypothetical protein J4732_01625 [Serratia marcescens]|uniref:Uncharacterized protein n=1 Tax=Serratia marcescens TaxID=615 RepID=A0A939NLE6_SERMA|nr:hypothetical protein [Serratia marcescens]